MRYFIVVMIIQLLGCYLGILIAFLLLKNYFAGAKGDYTDYRTDSFSLFPVPPSGNGTDNNIYYYKDARDPTVSLYYARVIM